MENIRDIRPSVVLNKGKDRINRIDKMKNQNPVSSIPHLVKNFCVFTAAFLSSVRQP